VRQLWGGKPAAKPKPASFNTSTASITRAEGTQHWEAKASWPLNANKHAPGNAILVIEYVGQVAERDVDVLVNRCRQDRPGAKDLEPSGVIGAAAEEGDAKRSSNDDHGFQKSREVLARLSQHGQSLNACQFPKRLPDLLEEDRPGEVVWNRAGFVGVSVVK
jgi:hypothetical protein